MARILAVLLVCSLAYTAFGQNKFVGVKMCSPCHRTDKQGKQFDIWSKSKHAEASKALASAQAEEIAKKKGLKKSAAESPECLECHAASADAAVVKDGVSCESCHGAGSAYKNMAVMKDKAKAIAAGLVIFKDDAAIEKFCKKCHNEKSPTFKGFKFEESWAKIKHPIPKG